VVPNSRATTGADHLRPLNLPRPITVLAEGDQPAVLIDGGRRERVAEVQDVWRIDDEWWRSPISRRYYRVLLASGSLRTIFHDLIADAWFAQTY
jgi:hypothetical protein